MESPALTAKTFSAQVNVSFTIAVALKNMLFYMG